MSTATFSPPRRAIALITTLATLAAASALFAGPLAPPAGPVASTAKPLAEVEPRIAINASNTPGDADSLFRITQRGSYYLTGNITGVAGRHGIEIAASGVTLDLMGFDLVGVAGTLDGVSITASRVSNVAVINGSLRNWSGDGVDLGTALAISCRVENVRASDNTGAGILCASGSTVSVCSATSNGALGISSLDGSSVTNCSASQNAGNGIQVGLSCTITDCSSFNNVGDGINADDGCTISGSTAGENSSSGIESGRSATIVNCSARLNAFNGISGSLGSQVTDCTASDNGATGISTAGGGMVAHCSVYNNLTGISGSDAEITHCTAYGNNGRGIVINVGTVANCALGFNTLDGIWANNSCVVRDNSVYASGLNASDGASIHVVGSNNRIEGNNCEAADRGIDVDVAGNIIIKNTCTGHGTNWVIAANNYYGPIIDRTGVLTAAVNGPAATGTLASSDSNANFSY